MKDTEFYKALMGSEKEKKRKLLYIDTEVMEALKQIKKKLKSRLSLSELAELCIEQYIDKYGNK